jgi:signal transduction histidine kinase
MKVALEMLPEGDKREQIATDIREMEALTSALLERERIKNRTAQPNHTELDLVAVTQGVIDGMVDRNPAVVLAESPQALSVQADEALLKVLLQNLLDNAVKFSLEDSGPVEVRLTGGEEFVTVRIDDDGPGIPEDMTERVLEPFVKLDPSRGHRSGYGLGLNLCQRIVEAHNGSIKIQSRQPRGTSVIVELRTG